MVAVAGEVGVFAGGMVAVAVEVTAAVVSLGASVAGLLVAVYDAVAGAEVDVAVAEGAASEGEVVGEEVKATVAVSVGVALAARAVGVAVEASKSWPLLADANHSPRLTVASTRITGSIATHPLLRSGACAVMRPPEMPCCQAA